MPPLPPSEREPRSTVYTLFNVTEVYEKGLWRQSWGIEWVKLRFCYLRLLCDVVCCLHHVILWVVPKPCGNILDAWKSDQNREVLWLVTTFAHRFYAHNPLFGDTAFTAVSWHRVLLRTSHWPHSLRSTRWHAVTTCVLAAHGALVPPRTSGFAMDGRYDLYSLSSILTNGSCYRSSSIWSQVIQYNWLTHITILMTPIELLG